VVGLLATATDLAALFLLVHLLNASPRVASLPALVCGVAVQFVGNKRFAFRDRSSRWGLQAALFLLVEALSVVANGLVFDAALRIVPNIHFMVLRVLSTSVVYFTVSLPLWSRIFHPTEER